MSRGRGWGRLARRGGGGMGKDEEAWLAVWGVYVGDGEE